MIQSISLVTCVLSEKLIRERRLNNFQKFENSRTFLNNSWVKEWIKREVRRHFELNIKTIVRILPELGEKGNWARCWSSLLKQQAIYNLVFITYCDGLNRSLKPEDVLTLPFFIYSHVTMHQLRIKLISGRRGGFIFQGTLNKNVQQFYAPLG